MTFAIGTIVQAQTGSINIRSDGSPFGEILGQQAATAVGTVTGGVVSVLGVSTQYIEFNSGTSGLTTISYLMERELEVGKRVIVSASFAQAPLLSRNNPTSSTDIAAGYVGTLINQVDDDYWLVHFDSGARGFMHERYLGIYVQTYPLNEAGAVANGWTKITRTIGGVSRNLFYKSPGSVWTGGSILIMHGGGGSYTQWCYESSASYGIPEQIAFTTAAINAGFACFVLDSHGSLVTDSWGRTAGKRYDAICVRGRNTVSTNNDLAFIADLIDTYIPSIRPVGSSESVFATGESDGSYMAFRAGIALNDKLTAVAVCAGGNPYGAWINCDPVLTPTRPDAPGVMYVRDTGKNILSVDANLDRNGKIGFLNESAWENRIGLGPWFMLLHHIHDVLDISCNTAAEMALDAHGYRRETSYIIQGSPDSPSTPNISHHYFQSDYITPVLDFFAALS